MQCLSRTLLLKGVLLLAVAILPVETVRGQGAKKVISKEVSFNTFDGVKLGGVLYPNTGGKRDAVVLLLHAFDLKAGGGQAGWSELAKTLHEDGYTVLSFDFRGFGESKTVDKDTFWAFPHNSGGLIKGSVKKGENLDHKNFNAGYLRYLVNDVAAAKAYLDRRNDAKELNSSNVIVMGAGEGAAVGAMWLANESRRRRDTNVPPTRFGPALAPQSEINDIACAVWLSISPKVGPTPGVGRWILEAGGKKHKVPMAFIFAKADTSGDTLARNYVKLIKPVAGKTKDFPNTGFFGIAGTAKLTGMKLIGEGDTTTKIKQYLDLVLEGRPAKEQKNRHSEASAYWYIWPNGNPKVLSKKAGQEAPQVDVTSLTGG